MKTLTTREQLVSRFREIREQRRLTQQQLADRLGVAHYTVSKIESGKWNFGVETLLHFASVLNFKIRF
jgi:transcriptional regulator with XRE-family HTH domain